MRAWARPREDQNDLASDGRTIFSTERINDQQSELLTEVLRRLEMRTGNGNSGSAHAGAAPCPLLRHLGSLISPSGSPAKPSPHWQTGPAKAHDCSVGSTSSATGNRRACTL